MRKANGFYLTGLRALDDALRPKTPAADGGNVVAETVFHIFFGEVATAAEGAGGKDEVMQALAVGNVFRAEPYFFQ